MIWIGEQNKRYHCVGNHLSISLQPVFLVENSAPARGHADVWLHRPQACAALRPAGSTQQQLSAYMDANSATKELAHNDHNIYGTNYY